MRNLPVLWSEGMFLRPQHFQAADRFWFELFTASEHCDHEYNYGLRRVELSPEAIANYEVQVAGIQARMPDGTLVDLETGKELGRADLREAFESESQVTAYLAVPKMNLGRANVGPSSNASGHRYQSLARAVPDEVAGGGDQEIQFRDLNVRVLLSTDDLEGYVALPIARINRAAEAEATPEIDEAYIPPLLACDAWPALQLGIVREIYDLIGKKIEVISQQVTNRGIGFESREPGDLDRLLMLTLLNSAYCVLRIHTYALGRHPFEVYVELCRVVGQLCVFSDPRRAPKVPRYDHDALGDIFHRIKLQIQVLLESVAPYRFEQRFFLGRGSRMEVALESKWLGSDWRWHVGVQFEGLKANECRELLAKSHWKLASSRQVDDIFKYGGEGIGLTPLERAPNPLPEERHWVYFDVDQQSLAFQDVLETQTLAMRLTEERIMNRDDLQGRELMILSYGNRQVKLKVSLFAVPVRT